MKFLEKQKGSAILITFLILGVLLISALSITFVTIQEFKASQSASKTTATYQVADEGVEAVMYEIIQAGYSQIDELHYCQSNGKIGGDEFGYEVTLLDKNEEMLHCGDDGNSPLSDIKKIKSVGTLAGQNQRSVVAFVPMACNGESDDEYTKLLLHFDGGDTGDEFVDATGEHTVSDHGDVEITNEEKVFCKSTYFDGDGDYLSLSGSSDWNLKDEDFTIDWWEYRTDDNEAVVLQREGGSYGSIYVVGYNQNGDGTLRFSATSDGTSWDIADNESMGTIDLDQWNHFAVVRSGEDFYTFKNGVLQNDWTSSLSIKDDSSLELWIGYRQTDRYFKGYIDELRISKGAARWTDDFDPPVYPY